MITCKTCNKEYGKTSLEYKGVSMWVVCDCSDIKESEVYFMNKDTLHIPDRELSEWLTCSFDNHKEEEIEG